MKLALVFRRFGPRGGTERYAMQLAAELAGRGHDVHLFASEVHAALLPAVTWHSVPTRGLSQTAKLLSFALGARRALAGVADEFDVIQAFGKTAGPHDVYRCGGGVHRRWREAELLRRRGLARPLRRVGYALSPLQYAAAWAEAHALAEGACAAVIAVSQRSKDDILESYGGDPSRVRVIYNGVDAAHFHPGLRRELGVEFRRKLGIRDGACLWLHVALNPMLKGADVAMRALGEARRSGVDAALVFVGRPGRRLAGAARRLGVADAVRFGGVLSDPRPAYAGADLLVYPTRYDTFGNVVTEAMACGVPAVTSGEPGAAELIADGVSGRVIADPEDWRAFAEAAVALADPAERGRMGRAAREVAEAHSLTANVDAVEALYREVAQAKRSRA
jgi:UDP-glucose:(heptosyl)LPS alpha-1,3-glucosyltransferase